MGNGNCRASLCGLVKSGLYDLLGIGVQGGCCLVEQKNLRIAEKCTGNGNTFCKSLHEHAQTYNFHERDRLTLLATRKLRSFASDGRLKTAGNC
jgi:hypothetical protein